MRALGPTPRLISEIGRELNLADPGIVLGETALWVRKNKETGGIYLIPLPLSLEVPEDNEGGTEESKKGKPPHPE